MIRATGILASEFDLPEQRLTYEDLEVRFGSETMKKVLAGAGIRNRRIAPPEICGSDMAFAAAERLLNDQKIDRGSIDLLIFCTQSPDYFLPSTSCVLHERLKLSKRCASFDINLGCSQYVYALSVAHSMICTGIASRALVLTGDTMTHTIHPMDRSIVPLMGDGGSASLVGEVPDGQGFVGFELGTDGSGHKYLMIPAGGFRNPYSKAAEIETVDQDGNTRAPQNLYMNGVAIFHFAITVVPETIKTLLAKLAIRMEDIDLFLFHQANKYMLEYLLKKLAIPVAKTHFFIEEVGNTSGSTLPILLTDAWRVGKLRSGALVLLIGFGVGLSWAATVIRWPENAMGTSLETSKK
jgi:3-oxoacyl-[acyl-carrier-protein] synthase-3